MAPLNFGAFFLILICKNMQIISFNSSGVVERLGLCSRGYSYSSHSHCGTDVFYWTLYLHSPAITANHPASRPAYRHVVSLSGAPIRQLDYSTVPQPDYPLPGFR